MVRRNLRPSILVVDDHELTADLLGRLFRGEGYDVHTAQGCRDALRVALQYGCDLLVSDVILADGDGCDLLRALRAYRPAAAVAITGHTDPSVEGRARRAGFHNVLAKPIVFAALLEAVERAWRASAGAA